MSVAPVRLHDRADHSPPPDGRGEAGGTARGHAHSHDHGHDHSHVHDHSHGHSHGHGTQAGAAGSAHHRHSHAPGERHPAARPGFSLLRLSAWQRLAIALPLAALIWAAALAVIGAGN